MSIITDHNTRALLAVAPEPFRSMIELAIVAGLSGAEVCGLTHDDVEIGLRGAAAGKARLACRPPGRRTPRYVQLSNRALDIVWRHEGATQPSKTASVPVFAVNGSAVPAEHYAAEVRRLCELAGVAWLAKYILRQTAVIRFAGVETFGIGRIGGGR